MPAAPARSGGPAVRCLAAAAALLVAGTAQALELGGYLGLEARGFLHRPAFAGQRHDDLSLLARPELWHVTEDGRHTVAITPFLRADSADGRRSHFDLREALYLRAEDRWELRVGVDTVFWGAAESRHLVDVINQTDLVENVDGEDKLGQPMVALALKRDFGVVDLYLLPGFRERTFPGRRGRLRTDPVVDTDAARYESGAGRGHVDLAVRWSRTFGAFDVGLAHFMGTGREPTLLPTRDAAGGAVLVPRYEQVHQSSVDLQGATGAWLWKLEALHRSGQGSAHVAWVAGFEYTLARVAGTAMDLGLLAEHLLDGRGAGAPQRFENDLFLGARLALNDVHGSSLLAGVIHDLDGEGSVFSLEASRRVGERWRLELEALAFNGITSRDPLRALDRDDHVLLRLLRYF